MTTPAMDIRAIPLGKLKLSATGSQAERRRHFDKATLAELAESIKAKGLLQPIVVRPIERSEALNYLPSDPTHEVVAGERRVMAAKVAGLKDIPANVRELTDEQVLEVQLIENLQRADVHPMGEAEGYDALCRLGHKVEEIAHRVGKSKAYVYARMKLIDLVKESRAAFYDGKLNPSTALYLARVPAGLQLQALKKITEVGFHGPMSARQVRDYLQRNFMLPLAQAPFDPKDVDLVKAAGACAKCPKRSGNNPDLFGDVSGADVCTDPVCYRGKVAAHLAREIATADEKGLRVILASEAKKLAPHGIANDVRGYVLLEDKDWDDPKTRTFGQILGKGYTPTLIVDELNGRLVPIAPKADLPEDRPRRASAGHDEYQARQREAQKKNLAERAYRAALFHKIRGAALKTVALSRLDLEEVAIELLERLSHDARRQFFKVMGWEGTKEKGRNDVSFDLPVAVGEHSDQSLAQLIRDLVLAPELIVFSYGSGKGEGLHDAAAHYKIDAKKLRAELAAAEKVKTKAKAKKPAARGKAKKARKS